MGEWFKNSTPISGTVHQKECSSSIWTNMTWSPRCKLQKGKKLSAKRCAMHVNKKQQKPSMYSCACTRTDYHWKKHTIN